MKTDSQRYAELEEKLKNTHPQSPEFLTLWQELENVKNRNGANVPVEFEDFADQSKLFGK